jgi:hypothetical protein
MDRLSFMSVDLCFANRVKYSNKIDMHSTSYKAISDTIETIMYDTDHVFVRNPMSIDSHKNIH